MNCIRPLFFLFLIVFSGLFFLCCVGGPEHATKSTPNSSTTLNFSCENTINQLQAELKKRDELIKLQEEKIKLLQSQINELKTLPPNTPKGKSNANK